MDFGVIDLDDDTRRFWAELRAFLDEHLTDEVHEHEWRTGDGIHVGFHLALGAKAWICPTWPVEEGGAGLTSLQAAILERELLARREPRITRGTTRLVMSAVQRWATDDVKAEIAWGVARGDIRMCLGYTEPDCGSDLAAVRTRAVRDGDDWVINGQKMFTTGAHNSQYAFLLARTNTEVPKHKGLTVFLVRLDLPGVDIGPVRTLGGERTNMVYLDDVRVSDRYRLGGVDDGWRVVNGPLNAEHRIDESGPGPLEESSGENDLYMEVYVEALHRLEVWAGDVTADGRRPIDEATTRRRIARIATNVELARMTPGPMGRIAGVEHFIRDAVQMLDLVGPAGLLGRGEVGAVGDGWFEFAHRFAQGTAIFGGTTDVHRNIVAQHYLGMPKSRPRA